MSVEFRGCSKCPINSLKPVTSTHRNQKEEILPAKDVTSERRRSLRLSNRALTAGVYCELNEDVDMDSDDDLEQDFQQGYLCVSEDPRRVGGPGGEPTIINLKELRTLLRKQQTREDQTVWLTTTQAGFPVVADAQEIQTDRDRFLGNPVVRFLHPAISSFIQTRWQELASTKQTPSHTEVLVKRLEETWRWAQPIARIPDERLEATWHRTQPSARLPDVSSKVTPQEKVLWEPDPKPLMANHPTRVIDSNTRISLSEGALTRPCPRDDRLAAAQPVLRRRRGVRRRLSQRPRRGRGPLTAAGQDRAHHVRLILLVSLVVVVDCRSVIKIDDDCSAIMNKSHRITTSVFKPLGAHT